MAQHRPHGALAGPDFGSFAGKASDLGRPVGDLTQGRPHSALAGVRFGLFTDKGGADPVIISISPGEDSVSVEWVGAATQYRINGGAATSLPDGTSPDTITGLTPNTEYDAPGLQLRNGVGGAWSVAVPFGTLNPGDGGGEVAAFITGAGGIASAEIFGTAVFARISRAQIFASGIPSAEAFGSPSVAGTFPGAIAPLGIPSEETFGTAVFGRISRASIAPSAIASAEAFGAASFSPTYEGTILPTGIPSEEVFGAATFRFRARFAPTGIPSAEAFGDASFSRPDTSGTISEKRFIGPRVGLRANGELIILF